MGLRPRDYVALITTDWWYRLVVECWRLCPGSIDLPFDPHTGVLRPDIWEPWLDWNPVRMVLRHASELRGLEGIWIDAGTRDE